jgi:hypothetical protein
MSAMLTCSRITRESGYCDGHAIGRKLPSIPRPKPRFRSTSLDSVVIRLPELLQQQRELMAIRRALSSVSILPVA